MKSKESPKSGFKLKLVTRQLFTFRAFCDTTFILGYTSHKNKWNS